MLCQQCGAKVDREFQSVFYRFKLGREDIICRKEELSLLKLRFQLVVYFVNVSGLKSAIGRVATHTVVRRLTHRPVMVLRNTVNYVDVDLGAQSGMRQHLLGR